MFYQTHIFICKNQRTPGKACCQTIDTDNLFDALKGKLKDLNLMGKGKIRLTQSGCLGRCAEGPILLIYPEQIWCRYRTIKDLDDILSHYLEKAPIPSHLLLSESSEQPITIHKYSSNRWLD